MLVGSHACSMTDVSVCPMPQYEVATNHHTIVGGTHVPCIRASYSPEVVQQSAP